MENPNVLMDMISIKKDKIEVSSIDILDIVPNPRNHAPIVNVDELMQQIIEQGRLLKPITVYKVKNNEFMLLDGERRYNACKRLGHEMIDAIIVEKPENEIQEELWILDANSQREETAEYRISRASDYKRLYYKLKDQNKIEPGILWRDFVGKHMNLSGRQVERLLHTPLDTTSEDSNNCIESEEEKEKQKLVKLIKALNKMTKQLNSLSTSIDDEETLELFCAALQEIGSTASNLLGSLK